MKQNKQQEFEDEKIKYEQSQHEILKAVAQAWHNHSNNAKEATSEFDARRRNFRSKPSRFKLEFEAMNKLKVDEEAKKAIWNFNHSLWDPYEIVAVSKKLESGLVFKYDFHDLHNVDYQMRVFKKRKESKNSLRNLFNMASSRRFNDSLQFSDPSIS
ncbi:DNA-directed RNA polymerase subunit beta [Bienertia sinuspersici]